MGTTDFKKFLNDSASQEAKKTINILPSKYKNLLKDYIFKFDLGTTLKGDKENVGVVQKIKDKKEIRVASSWSFSREFILLHEIGHVIYANFVAGKPIAKIWAKLSKKYKQKNEKGNEEETFCHRFAANYSQHPPTMFGKTTEDLASFFKQLEKSN